MSVKIDPKSIPRSYRDYLKKMVEMGEFCSGPGIHVWRTVPLRPTT